MTLNSVYSEAQAGMSPYCSHLTTGLCTRTIYHMYMILFSNRTVLKSAIIAKVRLNIKLIFKVPGSSPRIIIPLGVSIYEWIGGWHGSSLSRVGEDAFRSGKS